MPESETARRLPTSLPPDAAAAYLRRIGAAAPSAPTLAALADLQLHHLLSVPFENLAVVQREPIVLDEAALYAKIVARGRGGFCYELNGLFAWLLRRLGYAVDLVAAEVYSSAKGSYGPPFDHMALLVHLERPYLVDVGFGDSVRGPLPLPDGEATDVSGSYRLTTGGEQFYLERQTGAEWAPAYRFSARAHSLDDYAAMARFHSTSPDSHFTRGLVCSLATPSGRLTLTDDALVITANGAKQSIPVPVAERPALLRRHFALDTVSTR